MSDWLEHSVQVEVDVPIELAWGLWSDLEQMPRWMKWIESVKVLPDKPDLSRWKLATGGLEFSWLSRIVNIQTHQLIQWESVDGLPNRGAIRFYDRGPSGSIVKLSVAYRVPGILKLMDDLFLGRVVESTIEADLERFRTYALADKANRTATSAGTTDN
ncbi:SRPBCC family protein [Leptolyngbya sp. FACHB-261]|uniref:SRPBCC family protein n=1 Tax=Leptolyngbya sp. FACHB-261 TaxID=2692806 RepID=UPI00168711EA|nr:SRPBCC family protein [Leptolyngbya sp. FACHB-261]MBD2103457.1 SRPBCC family protein [Leptolyngbya sp. FACHB-261]